MLDNYHLVTIIVPKKTTHLLQPLDLKTNDSFKNMEKGAFRDYFTNSIPKELQIDPEKDVTTIKVDLKFSTLQIHPRQSWWQKSITTMKGGKQLWMAGR